MYDAANAPPEVAAFKAMLEASPTWVAQTGTIHYPSVSSGDSVAADAPPHIVIEPAQDTPRVLAPGVVLPGGRIQAILTIADATGAGIEKIARTILAEIAVLPTGLPITGTDVGMASEPTPGARAAQEFSDQNALGDANALRQIALIATYGLS